MVATNRAIPSGAQQRTKNPPSSSSPIALNLVECNDWGVWRDDRGHPVVAPEAPFKTKPLQSHRHKIRTLLVNKTVCRGRSREVREKRHQAADMNHKQQQQQQHQHHRQPSRRRQRGTTPVPENNNHNSNNDKEGKNAQTNGVSTAKQHQTHENYDHIPDRAVLIQQAFESYRPGFTGGAGDIVLTTKQQLHQPDTSQTVNATKEPSTTTRRQRRSSPRRRQTTTTTTTTNPVLDANGTPSKIVISSHHQTNDPNLPKLQQQQQQHPSTDLRQSHHRRNHHSSQRAGAGALMSSSSSPTSPNRASTTSNNKYSAVTTSKHHQNNNSSMWAILQCLCGQKAQQQHGKHHHHHHHEVLDARVPSMRTTTTSRKLTSSSSKREQQQQQQRRRIKKPSSRKGASGSGSSPPYTSIRISKMKLRQSSSGAAGGGTAAASSKAKDSWKRALAQDTFQKTYKHDFVTAKNVQTMQQRAHHVGAQLVLKQPSPSPKRKDDGAVAAGPTTMEEKSLAPELSVVTPDMTVVFLSAAEQRLQQEASEKNIVTIQARCV